MVIGITGGVGCGKSTVLNILKEEYGAHIIDADKVSHRLMEPGGAVYQKVRESFGEDVIGGNGQIDRKKLGGLVFNDRARLKELNAIVHPAVKDAIKEEIAKLADANVINNDRDGGIIAVEAALFIEAGYMDICDELWYIYTDDSIRADRLRCFRGYTDEKLESIVKNQLSDEEFRRYSDFVIDNGGTEENTLSQINKRLNRT